MASGSGPSPSGLIILTGMTIAAVVGLYAYDAIPRRDGVAPVANIAWPSWQTDNVAPAPMQTQSSQPPAYAPQNSGPQQPPQEQGYGPNPPPSQYPQEQYPQDTRGQDVPYHQQNTDGGAGQPPSDDGQR